MKDDGRIPRIKDTDMTDRLLTGRRDSGGHTQPHR